MYRRIRLALPLLTLDFVLGVNQISAANTAGTLDNSFGRNGVTVTTLTNGSENSGIVPYSVKLQTDGKILVFVDVVGTNSAGAFIISDVLRYTSGGVLDSTFGKDGIVVLPTTISAMGSMALQSNEQIVMAGLSGFDGPAIEVQRLNTNGSIG